MLNNHPSGSSLEQDGTGIGHYNPGHHGSGLGQGGNHERHCAARYGDGHYWNGRIQGTVRAYAASEGVPADSGYCYKGENSKGQHRLGHMHLERVGNLEL